MPHICWKNILSLGSSGSRLAAVAVLFVGAHGTALAADRVIAAGTATFECNVAKPGDTLTIAAGTRGPLRIRNCNGTKANPIVVRNEPDGSGPVTIRRTSGSGGFIFSCESCVGVTIDGSAKWRGAPSGKTYGIKVTVAGGGAPTTYLKVGGKSQFVTIRNVEIDGGSAANGGSGTGIDVNDHEYKRKAHPGVWREGILIEHNYVHDVAKEGMYVGPNYTQGDIPLRDVEIRFNRVEDTGFEGINTKSMWEGDNSIHHNTVRRAGKSGAHSSKAAQYTGISNMSGTVKIYNNWIEATGQHGIKIWAQDGPKPSEGKGPFEAHVWNNVIVNAGSLFRSFMQTSNGINVGAQDGVEKPVPYIYNNTIVNSRQSAINVAKNVGGGLVRDNIVAGTGKNPAISVPGMVSLVNNRVGTVAQMEFRDPNGMDYRLKTTSPARNQGTSNYPDDDFDDIQRPKEGSADQGAFEGNN